LKNICEVILKTFFGDVMVISDVITIFLKLYIVIICFKKRKAPRAWRFLRICY